MNVVREYIRNALTLTSVRDRPLIFKLLRKTIKGSNYPTIFINRAIDSLKEINVGKLRGERRFISCPYVPGAMDFIRRTIRKVSPVQLVLCPNVVISNKSKIFSNVKDRKDLNSTINASFMVKCSACVFSKKLYADLFDVGRTYEIALENEDSEIYQHCMEYGRKMDLAIDERGIVQYKNRADVNYAREAFRDYCG